MHFPSTFTRANIEFITMANSKKSKGDIYSVTLAKAISDELNIPASIIVDYNSYFNTNVKLKVEQIVYAINDMVLLNASKVVELTRNFYIYRVKTAYNPPVCLLTNKEMAIEEFMGVKDSINLNDLCVVGEDLTTTMYLTNEFRNIVKKMKDAS